MQSSLNPKLGDMDLKVRRNLASNIGSILFCEDWFRECWHKHGCNAEIVEKHVVQRITGRRGEFVGLTMSFFWSG